MSKQVAEPADAQSEEYEVLSIHSSENELGDESYSAHTGMDLSDTEDVVNSDNEGANDTEVMGDADSDDRSHARDELSESDSAGSGSQSQSPRGGRDSYKLPSDFPWSDRASIMADLDEGLDSRDGPDSDFEQLKQTWYDSFDISDDSEDEDDGADAGADETNASDEKSAADDERFGKWPVVILPKPSTRRSVKYIVLSGIWRPHYPRFFRRLHRQFPSISLIWVDLESYTVRRLTPSLPTPTRMELVKHGIRMDLYTTADDHIEGAHELVDMFECRGFAQLGVIPVADPDCMFTYMGGVMCNTNSPVEMNRSGLTHPLNFESDLSSIKESHLAAVLESANEASTLWILAARRDLARAVRNKRIFFAALGMLFIVLSQFLARTNFSLSTTRIVDGTVKHGWYLDFSHVSTEPFEKSFIDPKSSPAVDESRWSQAASLSKHVSDELTEKFSNVPSSLCAPSFAEIEEYFREIAIRLHKAMLIARNWSADQADWIKEHTREIWEPCSGAAEILGDVVGEHVHNARELAHQWTEQLVPLWQLGRQHVEQLIH